MKTRYAAPSLLLAGLLGLAAPAMASDEVAGAILGAGAGAVIGHAIDGHDGAVVGGVLGAMIGAAAADDDDRYWRGRPRPYVRYGYPRGYYYGPPPYWAGPRYGYPHWRNDRDGRWDRDGWRDRDGRWDRDRDRDRDHDRDRDGRRYDNDWWRDR